MSQNEEFSRYADDDRDPVVKDGLRALRGEQPSEDSRRATLAALGVATSSVAERAGPGMSRVLWRWALLGVAIGLAVFGVLRLLQG